MPARSKKDRKEQQRRKRERRELARQKRRRARAGASSPVEELRFDEAQPLDDVDEPEAYDVSDDADEWFDERDETTQSDAPPKLSEREDAAVRLWWDKYLAADGEARLKMTRQKLGIVSAADDCYRHYFPEAVFEMESKLPRERYPL